MPLLFSRHLFSDSTFAVWQIAEPESVFETGMLLTPEEALDVSLLKGLRRAEWWASRWLLHRLTGGGQRLPLAKTAFSKPFFLDRPDLYCSLSHSHGTIGALLSDQNCGCDLQVYVEKMRKIAPRFLHPEEAEWVSQYSMPVQMDLMHLFWTMKEALYKTYSLKALDFKDHIRIGPFDWDGYEGKCIGHIRKGDFKQQYWLIFGKNSLNSLEDGSEPENNQPDIPYYWTVCTEKNI